VKGKFPTRWLTFLTHFLKVQIYPLWRGFKLKNTTAIFSWRQIDFGQYFRVEAANN
jgi:hypothetical protein